MSTKILVVWCVGPPGFPKTFGGLARTRRYLCFFVGGGGSEWQKEGKEKGGSGLVVSHSLLRCCLLLGCEYPSVVVVRRGVVHLKSNLIIISEFKRLSKSF